MTNEEKKEFLRREKARLDLAEKLVDFSKDMSNTITKGIMSATENGKIDTKENVFTYKKGPWLWK